MFRSSALNFFFALGFAVFFLGILPLWDLTSQLDFLLLEEKNLTEELQGLEQKKDKLLRAYNLVSPENITRLEAVIPSPLSSFDIASMYFFFETIGRENGLRLEELSVIKNAESGNEKTSGSRRLRASPSFESQPRVEDTDVLTETPEDVSSDSAVKKNYSGNVKELKISIRATGAYENFKAFLKALENNLRLMDVDSFLINPASIEDKLDFTIKLTMYHQ